ncbi:hypothetical protein JL720_12532 [Aureococcus anophagefferens]|nr:hypothetical protein JL720_12532 [Aureococcus anophagefferens]
MGEWVESLVGDLDACLAREDAEPLASGPGRGATASPRLSLASLASRGISRASFAARRATSRRTLCSDSSKTTVRDCAEMLAPTLARVVAERAAARRRRRKETARLLRELDAHLLEAWGFHETRQIFVANVEGVVVKRLGRAARWHAELEALDDASAKERAAVAYLRAEMLSKKERTVMTTIAERLQGELEAPEEPPGAAPYVAAWAGVLCPIVVLLISVIMPSFVASSVDKTRSPLDHPRYPFETPLPESSVFYLLRWHPELNGTRLADHVAAEASGAPRSARDGLTDARVAEIHGAAIPRTSAAAVVVALLALLFGLHEDIQDTIIEEVFTFLPLASGFVAERTPGLESAGEDVGAAFGTPPDVAGEDEKSPEDAVALVLFDGGGDGDRVEAARPDDDEAAAERPDDAASDGEFLDDEEVFLDADVQRADEAGAADAEARGRGGGAGRPRGGDAEARADAARSAGGAADAEARARRRGAAKGAVVRDGVALDSDKVTRLAAGTEVVVTYAKQLPDKKTRYLIVKPVVGWVSRGAVAEARPARDDDDR